jgi:hypothetical protein
MPIIATALAVGSSVLPKVFQGGLKLFKGIGKKLKGIGKGIKNWRQKRQAKKNGVIAPEVIEETKNVQTQTNNIMDDEQNYNPDENTQKAFLGLQSVESGKKQQTKIMMIAGAIILALFFFMKKK